LIIAEEKIEPGPASRAIGLKVLRRRLISVLIAASKIRMGRKRFNTKDGSKPIHYEGTLNIG
jgi:hypothetical protein